MIKEYIQIETHTIHIYKKRKERLNKKKREMRERKKKKILTLSVKHKRSVYTSGYETAKEK